MSFWRSLNSGFRSLMHSKRTERELDEELQAFHDASVGEKMRQGMPADAAERAARIEMGSRNAVKHHVRSAGWESWVESFLSDLRLSLRGLMRSPGFTLIAVLSLALGIGANTAIFTLIKQVLLQSLPVYKPQQLVLFGKSLSNGILGGVDVGTYDQYTYDFALQLERHPGPFAGVASYSSFPPEVSVRVPGAGAAEQVTTSLVSGNFFGVLGAEPMIGRTITPSDASAPGQNAVVVVSHHFWQKVLSSDPAIVGRTININSTPFTVIGVMPERFHGMSRDFDPPDLWAPLTMAEAIMMQPGMLAPRSFYFLHMFARTSPQSSVAADQQWLDTQIRNYVLAGEGKTITPERRAEIGRLTDKLAPGGSGVSHIGDKYGTSLNILMAVVGIVLLIACANLANFLLARAVMRQREIATRLALGSSRARIVRQSFMEAILLSLAGGACGLAVAFAATRTLIAFVAEGATYSPLSARPDATTLLFTLGVSLLAGALFGLAPALHVGRSSARLASNANARTASGAGGRKGRFWPNALVTVQIMLSVLLLVGAGLFLRTLEKLQDQNLGFNQTHLLIAGFDPHLAGYTPEQVPGLNQRLIDRLSAIPGVQSVALSAVPPISQGAWHSSLTIPGYTPAPREDMGSVLERVSGRYFETTGIPIVAGRAIAPADHAGTAKVAVINEVIAKKYFPHGDAIGRTLKIGIDSVAGPWRIVGVAQNTKFFGPREKPSPIVYLPLAQIVGKNGEGIGDSFAYTMLLRTKRDPAGSIADLRRAVASVDPNLPLLQIRTIQEQVETFVSHETLISRLTTAFSALALLLACIGLYGVMSFGVLRRQNEIGVRIALGATQGGVQWMVLRESLWLLALGLVLGLPVALGAANAVRSQLYEMSPFDPSILAVAVLVIAAVTALAAWLPARRAAMVDPVVSLRCE